MISDVDFEIRQSGGLLDIFRAVQDYAPPVDEPFASVLDLGDKGIAISTDGVGTKLIVANSLGKYDTIGIDCVAMNVNDVLCVGAKPLALLDYIAVSEESAQYLADIAKGFVEGAKRAHITIPGGETAQMPHALDLVGTCVGSIDLSKVIYGQRMEEGDALIGFSSSGIHSNGFTLARQVFKDSGIGLSDYVPEFNRTLGEELLEPTIIYADLAQALLDAVDVRMFAHLTGGGFRNLARIPESLELGFSIETLPSILAIFDLIRRVGGVSDYIMYRTFNMGVGFCAVVPQVDVDLALAVGERENIRGTLMGRVVPGQGVKIHGI